MKQHVTSIPPGGAFAGGEIQHVTFWSLLVCTLFLAIRPLWLGAIPPVTDFGGHLIMADLWTRFDLEPAIQMLFERNDGLLQPQVFPARFVSLFHPWLDALTGLRLFLTLCLVGTIGSLMWALHAFGRSRWLIFLAMPLLWNGMMTLGLINYVAVFPFLFIGIVLAQQAARTGAKGPIIALGIIGFLAFLTHILGVLLFIGMTGFIILCNVPDRKRLRVLGALVPSALCWLIWTQTEWAEVASSKGGRTQWANPIEALDNFIYEAIDVVPASWDTNTLGAIVLIVLSLLCFGIAHRARSQSHVEENQTFTQTYALELLLAVLVIAYFCTPTYLRRIAVSIRLVPIIAFLFIMLPRGFSGRMAHATAAIGIVVTVVFSVQMSRAVTEFDQRYLKPMEPLLEKIPEGSRVQCADIYRQGPIFKRPSLSLNCDGLINARTGAIAGGGFSYTPFNATRFVDSRDNVNLPNGQWGVYKLLKRLDYVVAFGHGYRPLNTRAERVGAVGPRNRRLWRLYRVRHSPKREISHEAVAGGEGGTDFAWNCPKRRTIAKVSAAIDETTGGINGLRITCRKVGRVDTGSIYFRGLRLQGPQLGRQRIRGLKSLQCQSGEMLVGLSGTTDILVNSVQLTCAKLGTRLGKERPGPKAGTASGTPFDLRCPPGDIVVGIRGREGASLDAIGIACAPVNSVVRQATPKPPPPAPENAGDPPLRKGASLPPPPEEW